MYAVPAGIDGKDFTGAFASPSLTESPRTTAVLQHDVFLNSTSYRSGCLKLLLGNTGGVALYTEPDEHLLNPKKEGEYLE